MLRNAIGFMLAVVLMISVWFPSLKRLLAYASCPSNVQSEARAADRENGWAVSIRRLPLTLKPMRFIGHSIDAPFISARKPVWPNTC